MNWGIATKIGAWARSFRNMIQVVSEREKKFRSLAETMAAGVLIYQGERIHYANHEVESITGYSSTELLSMKFWELLHPDYQELAKERGLARQRGDQIRSHYEVRFATKDGRVRWVQLNASLIEYEGKPAGLVTAFDITSRKRAEEELQRSAARFQRMIESLPVAARVIQHGQLVFANAADAALFGFSSPAEMIQTEPNASAYIAEEDVPRLRSYAQSRLAGKPTPARYEAQARRRDGSVFPAEISCAVTVFNNQPALLVVMQDLTERKQLHLFESILSVCSLCGKVRDDTGTEHGHGVWNSLEQYVMKHTDTSLSHTFCPTCYVEYRKAQGLPPDPEAGT